MENNNKIIFLDESTNIEISSKNQYSISDCILVRKTDILPTEGKIYTPINSNNYSFVPSSFFDYIIADYVKEQYKNLPFDELIEKTLSVCKKIIFIMNLREAQFIFVLMG